MSWKFREYRDIASALEQTKRGLADALTQLQILIRDHEGMLAQNTGLIDEIARLHLNNVKLLEQNTGLASENARLRRLNGELLRGSFSIAHEHPLNGAVSHVETGQVSLVKGYDLK